MWQVEFGRRAERQLAKLDPTARDRILKRLKLVADSSDPRSLAEPLVGDWTGYWRFRAGDYRVIADIREDVLRVYVIEVGHRREVYR